MKTKITIVLIAVLSVLNFTSRAQSFYDLKTNTIDGKEFSFSSLKGKKVMIVNTASKCGFTPQYEDLEKVYKAYKDKNFVIIGFPANNFNKQEPGTNADIKEFCTKNYGVSFPMMEKISVKGEDMDPVYHWLTEKKLNGKIDSSVKWNFQKYLIDENGNLVDVAYSIEKPSDEKIVNWITK
ncbi:MAG TPA: glutathione peroxidase [Bacteroidia bacterium]|nr:glutathione peroxidase [Bacteroidia bacterium]HRG51555.1 glutathione peroxidase [Bacteroidia bacterium]